MAGKGCAVRRAQTSVRRSVGQAQVVGGCQGSEQLESSHGPEPHATVGGSQGSEKWTGMTLRTAPLF